jgi:sugar diacid utilization regulator
MEGTGGSTRGRTPPTEGRAEVVDDDWLAGVAKDAAHDAGDVPEEFLGDYLSMLADAAIFGHHPSRSDLQAVRLLGRRAAESGISAGRGVDLYLSAARRIWDELPPAVRDRDRAAVRAAAGAVLRVVDDAVASFAAGHAEGGRERIRQEETIRRELIDDLLRGDAHLGELVERAEPFGLDLNRAHQIGLARPAKRLPSIEAATSSLERIVLDRFGDRDMLVATKDGLIVVLALADDAETSGNAGSRTRPLSLGSLLYSELSRLRQGSPWRVAVGRAHPGAYGIARSYEEAREGLNIAARMSLEAPVIESRDILLYRVLFRDQPAIVDLVHSALEPLRQARGGARPLLDTLEAYFDSGSVATSAAVRLHLSVRAVTYRLDRVRTLTGYNPVDPHHRLTLQTAVLGAKLLRWPEKELVIQPSTG